MARDDEMRESASTSREKEISFFSANDRSPGYREGSPARSPGLNRSNVSHQSISPTLERAMRQKAEREEALLSKFSSLTGSPCKATSRKDRDAVLSPTRRHEQQANLYTGQEPTEDENESPSKMASDVFGFGTRPSSTRSTNHEYSIVDKMKQEETRVDFDGKPECQQS